MFIPVKLGVVALSLVIVSGLAGCTDEEAEKRAVAAEERAVVAEKRAAAAEEKILILEKELKKARQWSEADRKATEGRYAGSTGRGWTAF